MAYIPKDQMVAAEAADPIPRFRAQLVLAGVCSEAELDEIEESARAQVEDALATVMAAAPPPVDELDRDVYANSHNCPV
jgi:pyruvate dehydrogenase E1 component alpha subunit